MKQKLYILGLITILLTLLGVMFKINHFPGAAIMITLGMITFVLIFLPASLRNHYQTAGNRQNFFLYFIAWLTCFIVFTGMLFKILHWPGAGILLTIALPFPYVVFLPVFLLTTSRDKNFNIYNTVILLILMSVNSVFSALLSLDVSKNRIDDSLGLSVNYNKMENVLDVTVFINQQSPVINKIDELLKIVDEYQGIILKQKGVTEELWNKDPMLLPDKTGRPGSGIGDTRLETGLKNLIGLLKITPGCEELSQAASIIFDFQDVSEGNSEWTNRILRENALSWTLIYLDGLETNLKLVKASLN